MCNRNNYNPLKRKLNKIEKRKKKHSWCKKLKQYYKMEEIYSIINNNN